VVSPRVQLVFAAHPAGVGTWTEPATKLNKLKWAGPPPKIEVFFDEKHGFLLTVVFVVDKKKCSLSEEGLLAVFLQDLFDGDVLLADDRKGVAKAIEKEPATAKA